MDECQQRAERGAEWLDAHHPGWIDKINLHRLNLDNADECVLGQLVGSGHGWIWEQVMVKAGVPRARLALLTLSFVGSGWVANHGFLSLYGDRGEQEDAWVELIARRRLVEMESQIDYLGDVIVDEIQDLPVS